jgi:hypothetical protein
MSHMWREFHIGSSDGQASRFRCHGVLIRRLVLRIELTFARGVGSDVVNLVKKQDLEQTS